MKIILKLLKAFLNFIYFFLKLFKTKNKIVFLSRQSNEPSLDYKMIIDEIKKRDNDIEIIILCRKINNIKKELISYGLYTIKTMYHIATSKVCITDDYSLPVSVLKHKKDLKILQTWHSLAAIKQFGYQTIGKNSGRSKIISEELCMHKNYDCIISGSKYMTKYFSKAFNYPEKTFNNCGLPRIDYLIKNKDKLKEKILKSYPSLSKKKNILYVPTFRTTFDDKTEDLINSINFKKYNLIIKSHDLQSMKFDEKNVFTCNDYQSLDLLSVADYVISDYSAIAVEAAVLDLKTFYYVFDYEKYSLNNGLNVDLFKEMPGYVFKNAKDLINKLEKDDYNTKLLKKYKDKYITNQKGNSTEKITDIIMKWMENNEKKH